MFISKTKKQLIIMMSFIASVALIFCLALGFVDGKVENKAIASVETLDGVTFLDTKPWQSAGEGDDKCILLVTGFSAPTILADTENNYILGYEINGVDTFDDYGKKYYEGVTVKEIGGNKTFSAADIYGETYSDYYLIVYEIKSYSESNNYHVKAFVKQINTEGLLDGYETLKAAYGLPEGSPVNVTYNATPNAEFSGASKTLYNEQYTFTVEPEEGYAVDVYVNDSLVEPAAGVYTVAGSAVTEDLDILLDAYSTTDVIYDFEDATQPLNKHFAVVGGSIAETPASGQHYAGDYSAKFSLAGKWFHSIAFTGIRDKIAALQEIPAYAGYDTLSFMLYVDGGAWQIGDASTNKMFGIDKGAVYTNGSANVWVNICVPVSEMLSDSFDIYVNANTSDIYIDNIKFLKRITSYSLYTFEGADERATISADIGTYFDGKSSAVMTISNDYATTTGGYSLKIQGLLNQQAWWRISPLLDRINVAKGLEGAAYDTLVYRVYCPSGTLQIGGGAGQSFGYSVAQTNITSDSGWVTISMPLTSVSLNYAYYYCTASTIYIDDIKLVKPVTEHSLYSFDDADERETLSASIGSYFACKQGTISITNEQASTAGGYSLKISGGLTGQSVWWQILPPTNSTAFLDGLTAAKGIEGATFNALTFKVYCPEGTCQIGGGAGKSFGYSVAQTNITSDSGWVTISIPLTSVSLNYAYYYCTTSTTVYIDDIKLVTV